MSRRARLARWIAVLAVLGIAVLAGIYASVRVGPEQLRREVERQLADLTGAPVRVGELSIDVGLPVRLEGRDLELWGGALRVPRVRAQIRIGALLAGRLWLAHLDLEDASLVLGGEGGIPFGPDPESADPEEPALDVLEGIAEALLSGPLLADRLSAERARIALTWSPEPTAPPVEMLLEDVSGELAHSYLRDERRLVATSRLAPLAGGGEAALLEWEGAGDDEGALRLSLDAHDLDLAWFERIFPGLSARGRVSGVADLAVSAPGQGVLALDLAASDFDWLFADGSGSLWSAPQVATRVRADFEDRRVKVRGAEFQSGALALRADGELELRRAAEPRLALDLRLDSVGLAALRDAISTLPADWRDGWRGAWDSVEGGRLASLRAVGDLTPDAWLDALAGGAKALPKGLELDARLQGLRVNLDEDDAIDALSFGFSWVEDRLQLRELQGTRVGIPLPRLNLELDGFSALLAANLERRVPETDDVLLAGLPLLISLFEPDPERPGVEAPRVEMKIARVAHPTLFWPMRELDLAFEGRGGRIVGELRRGTWAGVPLRGSLVWRDDPERIDARLVVRSASGPPPAPRPAPGVGAERVWAEGSFEVGAFETRAWRQQKFRGRFRARASRVEIQDIDAELLPSGRLEGRLDLDLGEAEALPYRAGFVAADLDGAALFEQAELGKGGVRGRVDLRGDLHGRYVEGRHPFEALSGTLDVRARDGVVERTLPAILALTLAGEGLSFSSGEFVRYSRCEFELALADGVARTEAFEFDGPDVRLFGSGSLDLGHRPHPIDAEIVVFLFRPVDRALGSIPILGNLLLGGADNLIAAHFKLFGPWDAPSARSQPLRTLNAGPIRMVTGLPAIVRRGVEELGISFGVVKTPSPEGAAGDPPTAEVAP